MEHERTKLVHGLLERQALLRPEKTAYVQGAERYSYGEVNSMAELMAHWLLKVAAVGDRVALLLENTIEYVVSYYGVLKAGMVVVPLNTSLVAESLRGVLLELRPKVVISSGKFQSILQEGDLASFGVASLVMKSPPCPWRETRCSLHLWEEVLAATPVPCGTLPIPDTALASIVYTSGSTGRGKGVMLSHRNIVSNTFAIVEYLRLAEKDIQMVVLPFFYVMGKSLLNTHVAVGGTVVVNNRFAFPACVVEEMVREEVTGFSGVPSTYAHLLYRSPLAAYRQRLGSLRYCTQAGGHMPREVKVKLLQALPHHTRLYVMYGATEAAARLTYVTPEALRQKIDSIGKPIPGVCVRVLDEQGREVPTGQLGELVARGPNIMLGYWKDPEGTAQVLDENGYHTGDLGYMDAEGDLYVVGRKDWLLKVGGHRISPQEIEDVMMETEQLSEVVVVGVEDPLIGQRLVALAVPLEEDADADGILSYCAKKLPRYKLPAEIRFVPSLPKSSSGKIDRKGCLELLGKETEGGALSLVFAT